MPPCLALFLCLVTLLLRLLPVAHLGVCSFAPYYLLASVFVLVLREQQHGKDYPKCIAIPSTKEVKMGVVHIKHNERFERQATQHFHI